MKLRHQMKMTGKLSLTVVLAVVLILLLQILQSESKVTMEQMTKAGEMLRAVCQPKFKVTDEQIQTGIRDGQYPDDKALKCYANCILEMSNQIKKGKIQVDIAVKQMDLMLPDEIKEDAKNAMIACKDSAAGIKDNCEAGWALVKCFAAQTSVVVFP